MNLVLVVNDEPANLVLVTTQLLLQNYQVVTASVQEDAVQLARLLSPILIVMDLVLANGDGWQAMEALQQEAELRDIPVIVISARSEVSDKERALLAGARAYLIKPYDISELNATLRQYLN